MVAPPRRAIDRLSRSAKRHFRRRLPATKFSNPRTESVDCARVLRLALPDSDRNRGREQRLRERLGIERRGGPRPSRPHRHSARGSSADAAIPRMTPPFAVPSSLVRTIPVTCHRLGEDLGLGDRVLSARRIDHQPGLVRRARARPSRPPGGPSAAPASDRSWCAAVRPCRRWRRRSPRRWLA